MSIYVTTRAKAWSGRGIGDVRACVEGDAVSVYDDVAGHYTTCHSLGASAVARIRRLARAMTAQVRTDWLALSDVDVAMEAIRAGGHLYGSCGLDRWAAERGLDVGDAAEMVLAAYQD